jgi:polyphosphate kinase 2 (PPK2 family)
MSYTFRITGKKKIKLDHFDPNHDAGLTREEAEAKTAALCDELMELQELLYAASEQSVLIVLQGRDTSGKDGTIRIVMGR